MGPASGVGRCGGEATNGQDPATRLDAITVDASAPAADHGHADDLGGAVQLRCSASPVQLSESAWPYAADPTARRQKPPH